MARGERVTVKLYGGGEAIRRVVENKDRIIVVCSEEEYHLAELEDREPEGLGFPREDVLGIAV